MNLDIILFLLFPEGLGLCMPANFFVFFVFFVWLNVYNDNKGSNAMGICDNDIFFFPRDICNKCNILKGILNNCGGDGCGGVGGDYGDGGFCGGVRRGASSSVFYDCLLILLFQQLRVVRAATATHFRLDIRLQHQARAAVQAASTAQAAARAAHSRQLALSTV